MKRTTSSNKISIVKLTKSNYKKIIKDQIVLVPLVLSFVFLIIALLYLFFMSGSLPSQVPLYYSLPWGEERLADTSWMLAIPASIFIFFLINMIAIFASYRSEPILARMLAVSVGFVSFLAAYTMIRIILLIT